MLSVPCPQITWIWFSHYLAHSLSVCHSACTPVVPSLQWKCTSNWLRLDFNTEQSTPAPSVKRRNGNEKKEEKTHTHTHTQCHTQSARTYYKARSTKCKKAFRPLGHLLLRSNIVIDIVPCPVCAVEVNSFCFLSFFFAATKPHQNTFVFQVLSVTNGFFWWRPESRKQKKNQYNRVHTTHYTLSVSLTLMPMHTTVALWWIT